MKDATAEDGLDGPLFRSNLACKGGGGVTELSSYTILITITSSISNMKVLSVFLIKWE